jgi:hypothetical protein
MNENLNQEIENLFPNFKTNMKFLPNGGEIGWDKKKVTWSYTNIGNNNIDYKYQDFSNNNEAGGLDSREKFIEFLKVWLK